MNGAMHNAWTRGWTVSVRRLLSNGLFITALCAVSAIAWQILSAQSQMINELGQINRAARYHQDAETLQANLRADVNAVMTGSVFSAAVTCKLCEAAPTLQREFEHYGT